MKSPTLRARPPRLAVWLIDLFAPIERAESMAGDLLEEFAELAAKSGISIARSWYWRQGLGTIVHLVADGFLTAPWLVAGTALGGYLIGSALYWLTQKSVTSLLLDYPIYMHIDAYVFWLIYAILIERLIQPLLLGCIVSFAAKGREMTAAMTLSIAICAMSAAALVGSKHYWATANFQVLPLLITTFISPVLIVIGGGIVRKIRSAMPNHCIAPR